MPNKSTNNKVKNKPNFTSKIKNFKLTPRTILWLVIIAVVAVLITPPIYDKIVNTPKSYTKSEAKAYLEEQSKKINFPGELVYESIKDNGCYENTTNWLLRPIECSYSLKKYYKSKNALDTNMRLVDNFFIQNGWKRNAESSSSTYYENIISGSNSGKGILNYLAVSEDNPNYVVKLFSKSESNSENDLNNYLGIDDNIKLDQGEYVYGISTSRGYRQGSN